MKNNRAMQGYHIMNLRIGSAAIILIGLLILYFSEMTFSQQILVLASTLALGVWFLVRAQKISKISKIDIIK